MTKKREEERTTAKGKIARRTFLTQMWTFRKPKLIR